MIVPYYRHPTRAKGYEPLVANTVCINVVNETVMLGLYKNPLIVNIMETHVHSKLIVCIQAF